MRNRYSRLYSLVKIAFAPICVGKNKRGIWRHIARNIWLNYEGRRPEFSQNGGYAAGFAEWLRAIACHFTTDFEMLACCRLNFLMHMPSTHIYPSFYKSCVMLHYSQFSKWPKTSPQPKLKSNMSSVLEWPRLLKDRSEIGSNCHVLATANHMSCSMLDFRIHLLFYSNQRALPRNRYTMVDSADGIGKDCRYFQGLQIKWYLSCKYHSANW